MARKGETLDGAMSRFAPLFDALTKTQADELRLVGGERIYVLRSGTRQDLGKEPLRPTNIDPLAAEVLSPERLRALGPTPHVARIEHDSAAFFVAIRKNATGLTIVITPEAKGPPGGIFPSTEGPLRSVTVESPRVDMPVRREPEARVDVPVRREPEARMQRAPEPAGVAPPVVTRGFDVNPSGSDIDGILREMISQGASDLHLSSDNHPVLRLHGEMHFLTEWPKLTSEKIEALLSPIFSDKARVDFAEKSDADFAYEVPKLARFRVNAFRDRKGVGAVLRQIPIQILSAETLGLPKPVLDLCYLSKGLVVVTGPTGSGKSTTLAGMVDYINKNRQDHILTIEDPVEFVHENIKCLVNQREVGLHTKSFKNALRAALREDPDIVLVGEMRDLETISIAMETAETGHLVFGTLHTTTAISTIDRIIDQFPTDQQPQVRVMLSESLKGVVAQVLCKKIGGGRVAALEILLVNHAVAALIRDGKTFQIASVMQTAKGQGMITMNDSLLQLVVSKQVKALDAYVKAVDKSGLLLMFKNAGIASPI